jgi:hypothetical protein
LFKKWKSICYYIYLCYNVKDNEWGGN